MSMSSSCHDFGLLHELAEVKVHAAIRGRAQIADVRRQPKDVAVPEDQLGLVVEGGELAEGGIYGR